MKNHIIAILSVATISLSASALDVECSAGQLKNLVADPAAVSSLRVSGSIDAADLFFIAREMPSVQSLDLSDAVIEAYKGLKLNGLTSYDAGYIPQAVFAGSKIATLKLPAQGALTVGDFAFASTPLTSIAFGSNAVSISHGAFSACDELTSVIYGSNTRSSGYAFSDCVSLVEVNLSGCTEVGPADFAGCSGLEIVDGTSELTSIGRSAFAACSVLQHFTFGKKLREIGDCAFERTALQSAELQNCTSLGSIGDWAFAYDAALTSVDLPKAVSTLGQGIFFECTALASVQLPDGTVAVPAYAFKGNTSITDMTLPEGVGEVGQYAFMGAKSLRTVTLPSTVEYLGDRAMENAQALGKIDATALEYVPELGDDVWAGLNKPKINLTVDNNMADEFKSAEQWQDFNINDISSIVEGIDTPVESTVRTRFEGPVLMVESIGSDIAALQVFDPSGVLRAKISPDAASATVDTSDMNTRLYIVRCILADGTSATIKIAR